MTIQQMNHTVSNNGFKKPTMSEELFRSLALPKCKVVDREKEIIEICQNKKILHLGCVDDPLTLQRINNGDLLHLKIMEVASAVTGIDISEEGISYLKQHLKIDNIIHGNVEMPDSLKFRQDFDVVVVGELLEHLANPGLFLENLSNSCTTRTTVVISVPNAFAIKSFLRVMTGRELVHPDHVAYYSSRTLEALLQRHGFSMKSVKSYFVMSRNPIKRGLQSLLHLGVKFFSPFLADGLIVTASKRG